MNGGSGTMTHGWVLALALLLAGPVKEPLVIGLDHIPIAVDNLERAADQYRALGFALKPGRPHQRDSQSARQISRWHRARIDHGSRRP
jgi:glyoxalase-like protein